MSEERSSKGDSSGDRQARDRGRSRGKTAGEYPDDAGSIPASSTVREAYDRVMSAATGDWEPNVKGWDRDEWTREQAVAACFPDHRVKFLPPPGVKPSSFSRPITLPMWASATDHSREVQLHAFEWAFGPLGKVVHL